MFKTPKGLFEKIASGLSWDLIPEPIIYMMTALPLSYQVTCREESFCHLSTLKGESQHTTIVGGTTYSFQSTCLSRGLPKLPLSFCIVVRLDVYRPPGASYCLFLQFVSLETGLGSTGNCYPLCPEDISGSKHEK